MKMTITLQSRTITLIMTPCGKNNKRISNSIKTPMKTNANISNRNVISCQKLNRGTRSINTFDLIIFGFLIIIPHIKAAIADDIPKGVENAKIKNTPKSETKEISLLLLTNVMKNISKTPTMIPSNTPPATDHNPKISRFGEKFKSSLPSTS